MHDIPGKLTTAELAELFEGHTRLVERLAEQDDPLGAAPQVILELTEAEKLEALNAHPAIGAGNLSQRSAAEQGVGGDPVTLTDQVYEEKFGFRFVVFVNGRSKKEILEVLRRRLECTREEELDTALEELVAIAEDRWRHS